MRIPLLLHEQQEYQEQRLCGTASMATPSHDPDWPLASSVEDCTLTQEQHEALYFAEGVFSQIWEAPTPALYVGSQERSRWTRSVSTNAFEPQPLSLGFVQMKDWNRDAAYDETPPTCIHYRIDWRLMINKTVVSRNTEEDIVLEPTSYGPRVLQPHLEELLKRKVLPPRSVRADDTDVVVKVTERSEDDFVTQYEKTDIDWLQVERRLLKWSELFRKDKKLRVTISFRYLEVSPVTATKASKTINKQVRGSATQRMQADLTTELDAKQAATGRPAA